MKIRYIRDYTFGPNGNHWIELEAYSNGVNVALGKTVTYHGNITGWFGSEVVTDGIQGNFLEIVAFDDKVFIQVDLGEAFDIQEFKVWHYYADGRIYNGTKNEVSEDGVNWFTVFDSSISGVYKETVKGHSIVVPNLTAEPKVTSISIDNQKLSDEEEFDTAIIDFTFDQDIVAYSVRCNGTNYNTGILVEEFVSQSQNVLSVSESTVLQVKSILVSHLATTNKPMPKNTIFSAELDFTELYQEGSNRINVYGKNIQGMWSNYNQT